jgi:uncharacterized LabA/DUF88 family protein
MARVAVYIDGFNVFHAINDHQKYHKYKWLNYQALARRYVGGLDHVVHVKFFTAYPPWDAEKRRRHETYVEALKMMGVEVILGKFKKKRRRCHKCQNEYETHEEKLTDVNIAINMLDDAHHDRYDRAIIISGDTDILPAIVKIRSEPYNKEVDVVIPIGRKSDEMKQACDHAFKMTESQLHDCQMPAEVKRSDGTMLRRPSEWNEKPFPTS